MRTLNVEIKFLPGARSTYVDLESGKYRTIAAAGIHHSIDTVSQPNGLFGIALRSGPKHVDPGQTVHAVMVPLIYEPASDQIAAAGTFTVFEPPKVVAHGRVLDPSDNV